MAPPRRYRILYHHRTQALDGQRVHIRAIQDALREAGHTVCEVAPIEASESAGESPRPSWRRRLLAGPARRAPRGVYEMLELAYNVLGYRRLVAAVRTTSPDFIYERYALNMLAGVWASKRFAVPLLLEVNSPLALEKHRNGQLGFYRMAQSLERFVWTRATKVIAVSEVLGRMLRDMAPLDPSRVLVIHNGAQEDLYQGVHSHGVALRSDLDLADRVVIGAVGFFRRWHGIHLLLQCLSDSEVLRSQAQLLLAGDGPAIPELRHTAQELGVADRVSFLGAVAHDRVPALLSAMDCVVLPHAVEYASPLKLFEYMAAGRAIVAPRQDNLLEILSEGENALCFEPGDTTGLRQTLERLVGAPELRDQLGKAAAASLRSKGLTWRSNASRIVAAFEDCSPPPAGADRSPGS